MRNIYHAIMIAAAQKKGLRLTPEEVQELAQDNAIETAAIDDLSAEQQEELESQHADEFWALRKP